MRIRDMYMRVIRRIMAKYGIARAEVPPRWSVLPNASFADVLRYTDWYATKSDYRFGRYYSAIGEALGSRAKKWAHIDVGCGAGVFSWAFLDWAAMRGIDFSSVTLYGYDACPQMIRLARMIRGKLKRNIHGYPDLHYHSDMASFVRKLARSRIDADCLITFGYVLAGNHNEKDIRAFQRIILALLNAVPKGKNIYLLASDTSYSTSEEGWKKLLAALRASGVKSRRSRLIRHSGDRCVLLSRQEEAQR